jgi:hypothetical protein
MYYILKFFMNNTYYDLDRNNPNEQQNQGQHTKQPGQLAG